MTVGPVVDSGCCMKLVWRKASTRSSSRTRKYRSDNEPFSAMAEI